MTVIAVCVSQPKPFVLGNRQGQTGIFKQAVTGLVRVGRHGFEGDAQVDTKNHGGPHKAVYAYGSGERDYWARELNVETLPPGKFGENLLVEGLDGSTTCVGDVFRTGSTLLEITQPRIPCFKIGVAFDSKPMAKRFFDRGRTGVYLRVLEEGEVRAGDAWTQISSSNATVVTEQLYAACFHPNRLDNARGTIEEALEEPALAPNWRELCEKRLQAIEDAQ